MHEPEQNPWRLLEAEQGKVRLLQIEKDGWKRRAKAAERETAKLLFENLTLRAEIKAWMEGAITRKDKQDGE